MGALAVSHRQWAVLNSILFKFLRKKIIINMIDANNWKTKAAVTFSIQACRMK
jgi:hypothetical protein